MSGNKRSAPIKLSLLALPESTPAVLYGLDEVFSSVGTIWSELTGEGEARPRFDVAIVSADGAPRVTPARDRQRFRGSCRTA